MKKIISLVLCVALFVSAFALAGCSKKDDATNNGTDNNEYNETITRTPADKIAILKEMQENIKSIYSMIFKDLEELFYQIY